MKPFRQILSALTAAAMSVTLLTGILPAKAVEEPAPETGTNSDLSMTAENSLGQLMLDASQQDPSEDAGDYDVSAGVTGIVIENGKADVSYYTPVKADLVLAFYSDDEARMYASLNAEVSPAAPADDGTPANQNQTYTFSVPTDIPEYYIVKAYLIGAAFTPLCEAYSTNRYTESITKARTSKPSDYDPSLVVTLDETTDHNFLVLREKTVQITYDGEHNLLESYDEETGTYHFTNADAQLTSLQKGEVVYYNYNDGEDRLVLTVADISVSGTDVTITTEDMELSDAFSVVHIEETVQPDLDLTPGETYENGLTYIGSHEVSEPAANRLHPLAGANEPITLFENEFNWSSDDNMWKSKDLQQYDQDIKDFKETPDDTPMKEIPAGTFYGSIKGTAKLMLKLKSVLTYELFVWEDGQLCSTVDMENNITLTGSAAFKAVGKLFVVGFSKGMKSGIVITAGVGVEFDGEIKCSTGELTLSSVVSCKVWHGFLGIIKDADIHLNDLTCDATKFLQPDLEIKGFIGLFAEVSVKIVIKGYDDFGIGFTAKFGLEITYDPLATESQDSFFEHTCQSCHAGKIDIVGEATIKADILKLLNGDAKTSNKLADPRLHWRDFYISDDHHECGWDICPYRRYIVLFHTKRSLTDPTAVPNVSLTITGEDGTVYTCVTDENGDAKLFLDTGDYQIKAVCSGTVIETAILHDYQRDTLEIEMYPNEPLTEPSDEPNPEKGNILESGTCGAEGYDITWELDDNGTLWISGTGAIADYNATSNQAPWTAHSDAITKIIVGNGITVIGTYAFYHLEHVDYIHLSETLEALHSYAIFGCTSIQSIHLPDSLKQISTLSFSDCTGLTSITIPKNVTEIIGSMGGNFPENVTEIRVDKENPVYSDIDGVLFNKDHTILLLFPLGRTGEYTIPDSVEKIGFCESEGLTGKDFGMFIGCKLTSITMPDSVTAINSYCFSNATQLETIHLSNSLTLIPYYGFENCSQFKELTIPESVEEIRTSAFKNCFSGGSITIPGSVKTVGGSVFSRSQIQEIIFEEGVESIGKSCLRDCRARKVSFPASLKEMQTGNFINCSIKDIYFAGTEEQWNNFEFSKNATSLSYLKNSTIHFGESLDTSKGNAVKKTSSLYLAGDLPAQNASFTNLTPGAAYILYSVADKSAEQPLSPANLLYINQYTADENGCINADFTPVRDVTDAETFVMRVIAPEPEESALGDVNSDSTVNASDAAVILIAAAAIGAGNDSGLTDAQITAADVNHDGIVNASDAAVVLIYAAAIGAGQDVKIKDFVKS